MKKSTFFIAAIILIMVLPIPVLAQNKTANQIDSSKVWTRADYIRMYNGKPAYDIYYNQESLADNVANINIMRIYNAYGLNNYSELGLNSRSIIAESFLIGVDNSRGWYWIAAETRFYKNGENFYHKIESFGYIYPDPGSEGEYYLSLAKKIAKEKK
ncbi:MAG: hypothetical protein ACOYL8_00470 [Patescibacteria group bacterium]